jgi:hypothetical protein
MCWIFMDKGAGAGACGSIPAPCCFFLIRNHNRWKTILKYLKQILNHSIQKRELDFIAAGGKSGNDPARNPPPVHCTSVQPIKCASFILTRNPPTPKLY